MQEMEISELGSIISNNYYSPEVGGFIGNYGTWWLYNILPESQKERSHDPDLKLCPYSSTIVPIIRMLGVKTSELHNFCGIWRPGHQYEPPYKSPLMATSCSLLVKILLIYSERLCQPQPSHLGQIGETIGVIDLTYWDTIKTNSPKMHNLADELEIQQDNFKFVLQITKLKSSSGTWHDLTLRALTTIQENIDNLCRFTPFPPKEIWPSINKETYSCCPNAPHRFVFSDESCD